jgi:hypothetical protein
MAVAASLLGKKTESRPIVAGVFAGIKLFFAADTDLVSIAEADATTETDSAAEPTDSEESARASWPGWISTGFRAL